MTSVRVYRLAFELGKAIDAGDNRAVVALVDRWGLPEAERRDVCRHLTERARLGEEVTLRFDNRTDKATLARVWSRTA